MRRPRKTAGELSKKALADTTKYDALEVGHAIVEDVEEQLNTSISHHLNIVDEEGKHPWRELPEFTVVYQKAEDPLIKNAFRKKFYCCPFLPSPRPNQAVFLYAKRAGRITKRLWVLPSDMVMAELASLAVVDKRYKSMQAWSIAFFKGTFWDYIRYEHDIKMVSQQEYISQHREELIQAGCKLAQPGYANPFDFSKIHIEKVVDTQEASLAEDIA